MARSSRRRRTVTRRPRERADWVYRSNLRDEAGAVVDAFGSYEPQEKTITPAEGGSGVLWLYDSNNRMQVAQNLPGVGNAPSMMPRAARAEGKKALIKWVQGVIFMRPSAWASGNSYRVAMRFGMFEQDQSDGTALFNGAYTLWGVTTNNQHMPAVFANDGMWQHERRVGQTFNDNSQLWLQRFSFRVNRRLPPNFGYGCYIETLTGSVNLIIQPWLRTLVVDEG